MSAEVFFMLYETLTDLLNNDPAAYEYFTPCQRRCRRPSGSRGASTPCPS